MEKIESEADWQEEPEDKWNEHHPRRLIPELCQLFYHLGLEANFFLKMLTLSVITLFFRWVTGTGGGISIKLGYFFYQWPVMRDDV